MDNPDHPGTARRLARILFPRCNFTLHVGKEMTKVVVGSDWVKVHGNGALEANSSHLLQRALEHHQANMKDAKELRKVLLAAVREFLGDQNRPKEPISDGHLIREHAKGQSSEKLNELIQLRIEDVTALRQRAERSAAQFCDDLVQVARSQDHMFAELAIQGEVLRAMRDAEEKSDV
jgi:hypothetical protein